MDNLLLVGFNHKVASISLRERLAFTHDEVLRALETLQRDVLEEGCEVALISTCNRTEIIANSPNTCHAEQALRQFLGQKGDISSEILDEVLYVYHQADAARHLLRVSAGLDSLVVGENEIQGQVRMAFELAQQAETSGPVLNRLFRCAIRAGKAVRSDTEIGQTRLSVASVVVELAEQQLGDLNQKTALLIGAGKISTLAARELVCAGLQCVLVANRTFERAQKLVQNLGARYASAVHFDQLAEKLAEADIVICSTGAPHIVLRVQDVANGMQQRADRPMMVADLAIPRDADPDIHELANVNLYAIDDLSAQVEEKHPLTAQAWAEAETIVGSYLSEFQQWCEARRVVPLIRSLRAKTETIVAAEVKQTIKRMGPISSEQQEAIEYMGQAIVNKILHEPICCMKTQPEVLEQAETLQLVEALFGLELKIQKS
jgi:glutamyl-tRNA reductase